MIGGRIAPASVFVAVVAALALAANDEEVPRFVDVTAAAGIRFKHVCGAEDVKNYIFEAKGGGIGFFDYDNDGWQDLLIVQGSTLERIKTKSGLRCALFHNRGDGTFEDVSARSGLEHESWGMGVTFGDFDNDGYADIYFTNLGPNLLYRNNGNGSFTDVTSKAGVGDPRWSTSAAFGDFDSDGFLDLYVANYLDVGVDNLPPRSDFCNYLGVGVMCGPRGLKGSPDILYRNKGDGTFEDVTVKSGAVDKDSFFGLGVVAADIDNDGDLDLYVADDATPNLLFLNKGKGTFEEMGFLSGLAVSGNGSEQASMGIDVADYNNDGLLDVFSAHFASDYSTLYLNEGDLLFKDVTGEAQLQDPEWLLVAWGARFADFNLDGWKDIFHSNGHVYPFLQDGRFKETYYQMPSLYLNRKDGTFRDVSRLAGPGMQTPSLGRGVAFADYDNDGDIDAAIANLNGSPLLLRNDFSHDRHWLMVKTAGRLSNRDALGTRITVTTGKLKQVWEIKRTVGIYSASDPRAHFGLGDSATVDLLEIRWPSGQVQQFKEVAADLHYEVTEGGELRKEQISSQ